MLRVAQGVTPSEETVPNISEMKFGRPGGPRPVVDEFGLRSEISFSSTESRSTVVAEDLEEARGSLEQAVSRDVPLILVESRDLEAHAHIGSPC